MVNKKTNKRGRKTKKTRKTDRTNKKKTKGGISAIEPDVDFDLIKRLIKMNVRVIKGKDKENRKIDFDVITFHDFYDYLNETDMYLKKILTDELLAVTDPLKYKINQAELEGRTKIYPYVFGYKQKVKPAEGNFTRQN